ncbi:hypothetical protein D3C76_1210350 [compost metagenome]
MQLGGAAAGVNDPLRVGDADLAVHGRYHVWFRFSPGFLRCGGFFHGLGQLLGNVLGRLVVAHAMEDRMAHRAVLGHFGKGHFGQQRRFEPVHALGFVTGGRIHHGGLFRLQGQQLLVDVF